jgi:hypothetical protein
MLFTCWAEMALSKYKGEFSVTFWIPGFIVELIETLLLPFNPTKDRTPMLNNVKR